MPNSNSTVDIDFEKLGRNCTIKISMMAELPVWGGNQQAGRKNQLWSNI